MMAIPLQAGYVLELGKYVLALPLFPILLAVYVLVCKFILRPNTFDLKDVNGKSNNENAKLETRQILFLSVMGTWLILMFLPSVLPEGIW